jgi:membrane-associated protein
MNKRVLRLVCWSLLAGLLWSLLASAGWSQEAGVGIAIEEPAEGGLEGFILAVLRNLLNTRELMRVLGQPNFTIAAFITLNVIVFVETGLLVGFFLPGDSLLVTAGLICSSPHCGWPLPLLLATLCVSAIVGDSVGYSIGYKTGPKIFTREKSLFFNKDHLLKAQQFYDKHGGKTIILARFVPLLRTFAPVVAGVGRMEYRRFLLFNICGGIGWVCSMILFGYLLPKALNPLLQPFFGPQFLVEDHVEKIVILVVLASIMPIVIGALRHRLGKKAEVETPVGVAS